MNFQGTDTVLAIKQKLLAEISTGPCSAMRLIFGTDLLCDDWILGDHGLQSGDQLLLVISLAPCGFYKYDSYDFSHGPAGTKTWP